VGKGTGTEDPGNGLHAIFTLEGGANVANGAMGQIGTQCGSEVFVGAERAIRDPDDGPADTGHLLSPSDRCRQEGLGGGGKRIRRAPGRRRLCRG
jgi:hypothetical protein